MATNQMQSVPNKTSKTTKNTSKVIKSKYIRRTTRILTISRLFNHLTFLNLVTRTQRIHRTVSNTHSNLFTPSKFNINFILIFDHVDGRGQWRLLRQWRGHRGNGKQVFKLEDVQ